MGFYRGSCLLLLFVFFLINCWSSVVASVVLPQFVQSPLSFFHFFFFFFVFVFQYGRV